MLKIINFFRLLAVSFCCFQQFTRDFELTVCALFLGQKLRRHSFDSLCFGGLGSILNFVLHLPDTWLLKNSNTDILQTNLSLRNKKPRDDIDITSVLSTAYPIPYATKDADFFNVFF